MNLKITQKDIEQIQFEWGESVVNIGELFIQNKDFKKAAEIHVEKFYGYHDNVVLFKPTKVSQIQFRTTLKSAVSYFVGGNSSFPEDHGFALQPWTNVRFENSGFVINNDSALAMGNYYFTDLDGNETKVEYTFGYYLSESGVLKINVHHSSVPFNNK